MCANPQSNWLNTLAVRASYTLLILVKNKRKTGMGGLSPPGKNRNRNRFVFLSFGVDPLNWQSFIEIGEIACSTTARCSRGHATNLFRDWLRNCVTQLLEKRKYVFLECKYLQCATLYADEHTITGKTYLWNIFVDKILLGPSERFVITSLWNTWPFTIIFAIIGQKLMNIHSISICEWNSWRLEKWFLNDCGIYYTLNITELSNGRHELTTTFAKCNLYK